jgi:mono/diheme cytochrome c family protein
MSRWHVIALPILATIAIGASAPSGSGTRAAVARAVLAPFEAIVRRDSGALCADFTPSASAGLVPDAPAGSTCESAVGELFASTTPEEPPLATLSVSNVHSQGDHAWASLMFSRVYGTPNEASTGLETASVTLERIAGRWLFSTRARLRSVAGCGNPFRTSQCPPGARVLIFVLVSPMTAGPLLSLVPAAVKRAGGEELRAFEAGRTVYAQTGCAACHRIGDVGNAGPGPNLTHVGSTLSRSGIEKAILDASKPMPSFRRLPPAKLKAIVRFLSLLR